MNKLPFSIIYTEIKNSSPKVIGEGGGSKAAGIVVVPRKTSKE